MAVYPSRKRVTRRRPEQIARGLGWFSVGLGITQILAPRVVARIVGVPVPRTLVVACGLRELACGVGLLTQDEAAPWLRARVAGDVLDLAALGTSALISRAHRTRIGVVAAAAASVTALDVFCSRELALRGKRMPPRHETLEIEINRSPEDLYAFWRDFTNLPSVIPGLAAIQVIDVTRSRWIAGSPARMPLQWNSEVIDDLPGHRIAWRSLEGSSVFNAGSVQFDRLVSGGTRVCLELLYDVPPATLRVAVAKLFGRDSASTARADLAAFKRRMEAQENNTIRAL